LVPKHRLPLSGIFHGEEFNTFMDMLRAIVPFGDPITGSDITGKVLLFFDMLLSVAVAPGYVGVVQVLGSDFGTDTYTATFLKEIMVRVRFLLLESSRSKYLLWCTQPILVPVIKATNTPVENTAQLSTEFPR